MTQLLVSVRCAAEAEAALRGGAALIDVKEPAHGSLGRASDRTLAEVLGVVAGRRPVSAALGELLKSSGDDWPSDAASLAYVKWGLSGYEGRGEQVWRSELWLAFRAWKERWPRCRPVAVAYADWQRAGAPQPEAVCAFAVENAAGAFLIDTWRKDGSTLLDWLALEEIARFQKQCRAAQVPLALAGSLGIAEMKTLLPLRPEWFAVRGAVCQGRQRGARLEEGKVRQLFAYLSENDSLHSPH